jgi:hypothetical protein
MIRHVLPSVRVQGEPAPAYGDNCEHYDMVISWFAHYPNTDKSPIPTVATDINNKVCNDSQ